VLAIRTISPSACGIERGVKVSVVVPCYNAAETLARQLKALAWQTVEPWEVIVADNGSTDDSVAVARRFGATLPRFAVVDARGRQCASHARNVGARAASGDVLAFCDADDEVAPGWIAGLQRALLDHDFVASRFDLTKLNPFERYVHPQATGLIRDPTFDFLPRAGACGLAIRRHIHDSVGGFDEHIRYHEDTDYCWKIQLLGVKLGWAPEAVVHVELRHNSGDRVRQARLWAAAQVMIYKKYRRLGMAKISNGAAVREWLTLLRLMARVAVGRASFSNGLAWRVGTRLGRLQGSVICATLLL
jgi:glycosyltransferase involved in cell wall biosynthesis